MCRRGTKRNDAWSPVSSACRYDLVPTSSVGTLTLGSLRETSAAPRHRLPAFRLRLTDAYPNRGTVDHEILHQVLRRFARTMTRRYDISEVLHELGDHTVEIMDCAGVGVSVVDANGDLRFATATSQPVVAAEQAQEEAQDGPCFAALHERRPVVIEDVRDHAERWPTFVATVADHGLSAVVGLPLILDEERIGTINVYDRGRRTWTDEEISQALVLGDVAAAYIYNASELARSRRTAEQLQHALDSRIVIEQAKGILAASRQLTMDDAFNLLRRHARSNSITVRSVAERIVSDGAETIADE